MIIRNAEITSVLAAARASGADIGSISREGNGPLYTWRLTLALRVPRDQYGLKRRLRKQAALKYQRVGANGRGKQTVCWHANRNFLLALFHREPLCEVESPLGRFVGSVDFALNHPQTAYRELGTAMRPLLWVDACKCSSNPSEPDEWGYAGGTWEPSAPKPAIKTERPTGVRAQGEHVLAEFAHSPGEVKVFDYSPEDGVWTRELADGTVEVLCD